MKCEFQNPKCEKDADYMIRFPVGLGDLADWSYIFLCQEHADNFFSLALSQTIYFEAWRLKGGEERWKEKKEL